MRASENSLDIPLGRRIAEIMKEKGSAYSLQAMGKRIGLSRETLRLMLHVAASFPCRENGAAFSFSLAEKFLLDCRMLHIGT